MRQDMTSFRNAADLLQIPPERMEWVQTLARSYLESEDVDLEAPDPAQLRANPRFFSSAVLCGAAHVTGKADLDRLFDAARLDELLVDPPTLERRELCHDRARLVTWVLTADRPFLTAGELRILEMLNARDDPAGASRRLLNASLDCTPDELCGAPTPPACERRETCWIREFVVLFTLFPEEKHPAVRRAVSEFCGGGPFTCTRLFAMKAAQDFERNSLASRIFLAE